MNMIFIAGKIEKQVVPLGRQPVMIARMKGKAALAKQRLLEKAALVKLRLSGAAAPEPAPAAASLSLLVPEVVSESKLNLEGAKAGSTAKKELQIVGVDGKAQKEEDNLGHDNRRDRNLPAACPHLYLRRRRPTPESVQLRELQARQKAEEDDMVRELKARQKAEQDDLIQQLADTRGLETDALIIAESTLKLVGEECKKAGSTAEDEAGGVGCEDQDQDTPMAAVRDKEKIPRLNLNTSRCESEEILPDALLFVNPDQRSCSQPRLEESILRQSPSPSCPRRSEPTPRLSNGLLNDAKTFTSTDGRGVTTTEMQKRMEGQGVVSARAQSPAASIPMNLPRITRRFTRPEPQQGSAEPCTVTSQKAGEVNMKQNQEDRLRGHWDTIDSPAQTQGEKKDSDDANVITENNVIAEVSKIDATSGDRQFAPDEIEASSAPRSFVCPLVETVCSNSCKGPDAAATHWCFECNKSLCHVCVLFHARQATTESHELQEMSVLRAQQDLDTQLSCIRETSMEQRRQSQAQQVKLEREKKELKERIHELEQELEERIHKLEKEASRIEAVSEEEARRTEAREEEVNREKQILEDCARIKVITPSSSVLNGSVSMHSIFAGSASPQFMLEQSARNSTISLRANASTSAVPDFQTDAQNISIIEPLTVLMRSPQDVSMYVQGLRDDFGERAKEYSELMVREDINGQMFLELNDNDLKELKFTYGHRKLLLSRIARLRQAADFL